MQNGTKKMEDFRYKSLYKKHSGKDTIEQLPGAIVREPSEYLKPEYSKTSRSNKSK